MRTSRKNIPEIVLSFFYESKTADFRTGRLPYFLSRVCRKYVFVLFFRPQQGHDACNISKIIMFSIIPKTTVFGTIFQNYTEKTGFGTIFQNDTENDRFRLGFWYNFENTRKSAKNERRLAAQKLVRKNVLSVHV